MDIVVVLASPLSSDSAFRKYTEPSVPILERFGVNQSLLQTQDMAVEAITYFSVCTTVESPN